MADKTFVGGGGIIFRAPAGTALPSATNGIPTDTQLTSGGFVEVGVISDAGLKFAPSRDSKPIKDWGGNTIRTIYTGHTETFKFALDDFVGEIAWKAAYGDDNVTVTAANTTHGNITKTVFDDTMDTAAAWVFLMDDNGKTVLAYAPQCEITGWDEVNFGADDIAKHGLTATASKISTSAETVVILADDGEKTK